MIINCTQFESDMTSCLLMLCLLMTSLMTSLRHVGGVKDERTVTISSDVTDGEVLIGGSVTITCDKNGNDYPPGRWELAWYRSEQRYPYDFDYDVLWNQRDRIEDVDRLDGTHDFVISNLSVSDSGEYYCNWYDDWDIVDRDVWKNIWSTNNISFNVCSPKCSSSEVETVACTIEHDRECSPRHQTTPAPGK